VLSVSGSILWRDRGTPRPVALQSTVAGGSAVWGSVTFLSGGSNPRIRLSCGYAPSSAYAGSGVIYTLRLYNRRKVARELLYWPAGPGGDFEAVRESPWPKQAISRIEVTTASGVVLSLNL